MAIGTCIYPRRFLIRVSPPPDRTLLPRVGRQTTRIRSKGKVLQRQETQTLPKQGNDPATYWRLERLIGRIRQISCFAQLRRHATMIIALERIQSRSCPHYPRWWGGTAAAGRLPCLVGSCAGRLPRTFLWGSTERHHGNGRYLGVRLSPLRICEYSTSFGGQGLARTRAASMYCLLCERMTRSVLIAME